MLKLPKRGGGNGASQGLLFLLSPIFLCHKIKDFARPPKIRLHCRQGASWCEPCIRTLEGLTRALRRTYVRCAKQAGAQGLLILNLIGYYCGDDWHFRLGWYRLCDRKKSLGTAPGFGFWWTSEKIHIRSNFSVYRLQLAWISAVSLSRKTPLSARGDGRNSG